ncbi:MAG TPA: hypothetical protein VK991_11555 [Halomonas sp.]|nr:hypothetical protein [Halomonas sp.]
MKRTLTLSVLLSLSAASPLALALGLGDAQVGSTIDSPLRATVPLLAAPADLDPGRVNVTLASAGAFEAAGMSLTPAARSVRAEVRRRNGALVLDLASQSPVTDPWLDLLLEFHMPDGRRDVRQARQALFLLPRFVRRTFPRYPLPFLKLRKMPVAYLVLERLQEFY